MPCTWRLEVGRDAAVTTSARRPAARGAGTFRRRRRGARTATERRRRESGRSSRRPGARLPGATPRRTLATVVPAQSLQGVADLQDRLLALAEEDGVEEVGDRLGVEDARAAGDDERIGFGTLRGREPYAAEIEHVEQVRVRQLVAEAHARGRRSRAGPGASRGSRAAAPSDRSWACRSTSGAKHRSASRSGRSLSTS